MKKEAPDFRKHPLGRNPYRFKVSRSELYLAHLHRLETGEPMQTWVRRLIRENFDAHRKGSERWTLPLDIVD